MNNRNRQIKVIERSMYQLNVPSHDLLNLIKMEHFDPKNMYRVFYKKTEKGPTYQKDIGHMCSSYQAKEYFKAYFKHKKILRVVKWLTFKHKIETEYCK